MVKLAWVLAPLAVTALWLLLRSWRGQRLGRRRLNAAFSLLLLVYLLGTAGLGLFWVANQELPVFDWHYLTGYTMLAVLAVHLAFNLPQLLRQLRDPNPPDARLQLARRPLLRTIGWAAGASLIGYGIGLRHGRTELRLRSDQNAASSAGVGPSPQPDAWSLIELAHRHTAHGRDQLLRRAAGGWAVAPPSFKPLGEGPLLDLPAPMSGTRPDATDLATSSTWLWHAAGISQRRGGLALRTAPSAGALFAAELYVAVAPGLGVAPGWWHYRPERHALQRLADAASPEALGLPAGAKLVVVASAVFARTGHKYRDRSWRYLLADMGHALENLRLAMAATGQRLPLFLRCFDEQRLADPLGLDQASEGVLAVVVADAARPEEAGQARWQPVAATPGDGAADELTRSLHRLSSLTLATGGTGAAAAALPIVVAPRPEGIAVPLPAPRKRVADALGLIARRRSSRRFASRAIAQQALADVLAAMSAPPPTYASGLVIDVLSAAVEGLPGAAWRWHPPSLWRRVEHGASLRARARAAALDQDVIGDAAAVIVLSMRHGSLRADPAGPARGYRHAWLEVGMLGERAYLAATELGLAVCAVGAFYDDELRSLIGSGDDEWPVHLVALGHPG